ncbi:Uncharacterised protein [Mycobacteroides abscessus]|uniref:hypothetical protein n=1 Tax=Mycobacteroides abscessus TaxID=36809 RepID=UPI0005DE62A6|nr:hypothetical protein [Mycobacteroides abscessus]CPR33704.1 Uncharacterised protein [Mycobacteroides abscessus]CPR76478.1 Uncharacterised protein [Mycobacteroides abscessus]CPR77097.1 Uncharacterised protein [Mycobacteroides abscessus]CPR78109.1 Uncharacterised protein [Mycobacteroides abscessus]CPS25156.1 Uncharacterised protein [Mycobacteroides abscessus]
MTKIPESIEDAVLNLKGLGELITASEWQRAALVWAFTQEGKPGPPGDRTTSGPISINDFTRQGISGLKSKETVRKYRRAWSKAIADGFTTNVKPGDLIDLPEVEWQPYFNPETATDTGLKMEPTSDEESDDVPYDPIPMDPFVSWMKDLTRVVEKGYRVRMDLALKGDKNTMRTVITEAMGALQRLLETEELKETVK